MVVPLNALPFLISSIYLSTWGYYLYEQRRRTPTREQKSLAPGYLRGLGVGRLRVGGLGLEGNVLL